MIQQNLGAALKGGATEHLLEHTSFSVFGGHHTDYY